MDNYPDHLAPAFDASGAVATSFAEWWPMARVAFPHVPEEVAREWLHRHWRHSPWSWLPSADYRFHIEKWGAERLLEPEIRWRHDNFAASLDNRLQHAEFILGLAPGWRPWVAEYMKEHRDFPSRPILLDNRDGHLLGDFANDQYPDAYLLIEGHNRLEHATHWASKGLLVPTVEFWVMTHV